MALKKIAYECPAYMVVVNEPVSWGARKGLVILKDGDKLGLLKEHPRHGMMASKYRVGSVVAMAMEDGEDPIAARERNRRNGGKDHWINASAVSIVAWERPREVLIYVELGMLVLIEGVVYEIVAEPNNNLGLKKVRMLEEEAAA